jgi:hypothetical protein
MSYTLGKYIGLVEDDYPLCISNDDIYYYEHVSGEHILLDIRTGNVTKNLLIRANDGLIEKINKILGSNLTEINILINKKLYFYSSKVNVYRQYVGLWHSTFVNASLNYSLDAHIVSDILFGTANGYLDTVIRKYHEEFMINAKLILNDPLPQTLLLKSHNTATYPRPPTDEFIQISKYTDKSTSTIF